MISDRDRIVASRRCIALLGLGILASATFDGDRLFATTVPAIAHPAVVLKLNDLRSAYLLRLGSVRYDANAQSSESVRDQLRRHFDVVLELLLAGTSPSIETALYRLEAASANSWSPRERDSWRRQLLVNRYTQIVRLRDYRDRGIFPLNEGQTPQPTPIFVDQHDTACAVGHLMRLSGWRSEVQNIRNANNLVHISDAAGGRIQDWILTSGLTREEAALIQPGYPNFATPSPINPTGFVDDTSSFVFGDLRYSKFAVTRIDGTLDAPQANIDVMQVFCGLMNCSAQSDYGRTAILGDDDDSRRVNIQFDVEVTSPDLRIADASATTLLNSVARGQGRNDLALYLDSNQDQVFLDYSAEIADEKTHRFDALYAFATLSVRPALPPVRSMRVVTEMYAPANGTTFAQLVQFAVVPAPEPASISLLATAVALVVAARIMRA
jgi:hypothetical protein